MGARNAIERAFMHMVSETPFKKISVSEICVRSGVSRKVFYSLFADKKAIVERLFAEQVMEPIYRLHDLLDFSELSVFSERLHERYYRNIHANRDYYLNLARSMWDDDGTFVRIISRVIYDYDRKLFQTRYTNVEPWKVEYIATHFSSSQAAMTQKWLLEGMAVPVEDIAHLNYLMVVPYWLNLETPKA